ncbi:MAG: MarR family transcriptional regulator [Pseudomonadota bacterium]
MPEHPTTTQEPEAGEALRLWFTMFNEIGIIAQLSRTMLENRLPDGLIGPHFTVLNHLTRLGDGRTPLAMARAFQTPKTSMTHTLATLEARGLIALRPNPEDGRSKLVYLTEAGRNVHQQAILDLGPDVAQLSQVCPTQTVAQVVPLLQEVRKVLDENRPD